MDIMPIHLEKNNKFAVDYQHKLEISKQYFHYHPYKDDENRLADIQKRTFNRKALSKVLEQMNKEWDAPVETLEQIERLKDPMSTVVIGGQQAGLLTGPSYTMNKIITVIRLAKEKENELNQPVLPVFWIAGEDHDFDEINHVFSIKDNKLYKHLINQYDSTGKSVSDININRKSTRLNSSHLAISYAVLCLKKKTIKNKTL